MKHKNHTTVAFISGLFSHGKVACTGLVYLDADFMGLRRGYLHLFDGQRLPRLPGNCCLALDHLKSKVQHSVVQTKLLHLLK